jgi:hypothetical protein
MDEQHKCDGCDNDFADEEMTRCRVDYPDEDWETFLFCNKCIGKDDAARPI